MQNPWKNFILASRLRIRYLISYGKLPVIFPLISTPGAYLILKLWDMALISGWQSKEGGAYFKVREIIYMRFQKFEISFFQKRIKSYHYGI